MKTTYGFSRRGPDRVAEELATVLSTNASFEFKALFTLVFANLRARNAAGGGEEMLRLRAYEKLQNLVQAGIVKKNAKEYKGVAAALASFLATAAELNAKFAAGTHVRPPSPAVAAAKPPEPLVRPPSPVLATAKRPAAAKSPAVAKSPAAKKVSRPAKATQRAA